MRYVTSIERLAQEEGRLLITREYLIKILQTRFGVAPEPIVEVINRLEDLSVLDTLFTRAITISSVEEFQQVLDETIS
ncbi:hypothetical protein NUACC21_26250 [Scytonema sp. NUACC21]